MNNLLKDFGDSAKELSRNPLGIIALFIVLVYGFACLLFGFSAKDLTEEERLPLIWFTITFPILVLCLFTWLVTKHHDKLYSPKDYRKDESFLETLNQKIQSKSTKPEESEKNIKDLMSYGQEFSIISEQEDIIIRDLKGRDLEHESKTAKVLIHQLAAVQVLNWFERTYNTLFGSQIALLKLLNESISGVTNSFVSNYFEDVKNRYPKVLDVWKTENYLQYLITSRLIEKNEENITITKRGKEFLIWLSKSGASENKIL